MSDENKTEYVPDLDDVTSDFDDNTRVFTLDKRLGKRPAKTGPKPGSLSTKKREDLKKTMVEDAFLDVFAIINGIYTVNGAGTMGINGEVGDKYTHLHRFALTDPKKFYDTLGKYLATKNGGVGDGKVIVQILNNTQKVVD